MQGKRKEFDKELHKKYDKLAREYAIAMFRDVYGCQAEDNPDRYGIDLIVKNLGKVISYAEVEIKKHLANFRFSTLHILERKKKFFTSPTGEPVLFCLFSETGNICAMTRGDYLLDMEPVEVKNVQVGSGEFYYKVPLGLVRFIRRKEHEM